MPGPSYYSGSCALSEGCCAWQPILREPLSIYWPETVEAELAGYPRVEAASGNFGFALLLELKTFTVGNLPPSIRPH
jgi:hypothetical protein